MSRKYRNKEEIVEAISNDYAWRIRELSCVKKDAESAKDKAVNTAIRQGILMLYAHWEGFVKFSATAYLQFIVDSGLKQCELTDNFLGIILRKNYKDQCSTYSIKHHIFAAQCLLNDSQKCVFFDPKVLIKTDSNLSYELFENILDTLAIDSNKYKTKCQLINESLLSRRNKIAHGEYDIPSLKSFLCLYDNIINVLCEFKDDLQNLCCTEGYKKQM